MRREYAVVAGGAGNLGAQISRGLRAGGLDVVVLDRAESAVDGVVTVKLDLVDHALVGREIEALIAGRGAPSVLVNAQGWSPKPDTGISPGSVGTELFSMVVDINLTSCYTTMRHIVPAMAEAGVGRVVNISSAAAYTGRTTATAGYAAAKAGLDALTRSFAAQYSSQGVLICGVAPGKFGSPGWLDDRTAIDRYLGEIPIGRLATVDEVADVVEFFVRSNTYITGQTVLVDGGRLS
ncbi:3-oxoacyl-(acyl-carrier-protein) reductase, putative [Mycolicibacterium phlei]|uniref:SDR family NAD(P)-dependent oxidoreductase n=1 Tax=Mycobacteroides chelonae TaxID=1774 RepID=UPI000695EF11|nr:SDR family oxidoreductase [Mycobacteroides chelonae]ANB00876.1 hypothetical protein BB28_08255 [Mycobacteroides chelonae CCUG 47445]OLT75156.1 hypothetical protein BKG56_15380 [Mycobacteroides chelonae]ORV12804.1 hypothetical protein AWB96_15620 [Mycobacteroides chelonae]VEG15796.1 3-oxoacyl-(acyl-carrier-protein) reductase, putative [Mycolicibacterium phlei]